LLIAAVAHAQDVPTPVIPPPVTVGTSGGPPPSTEGQMTRLWPATLGVAAMIGVEPQGIQGNPMAFGVAAEALWRGRVGGFAAVLSSEGTPILAQPTGRIVNGMPENAPSLGDRISVPFGVAYHPFTTLAPHANPYIRQLLAGIGVQAGITVEHVRTSDDSQTVAGFHGAVSVEVPIFGGPTAGGVTIKVYGRLLATQEIKLDTKITQQVDEGPVSGQFYGGLCYYP
jgi:hypothetical protein